MTSDWQFEGFRDRAGASREGGGRLESVAETGVPIRSDPVPVAPGIGLPEESATVTVIVSTPSAKPVVSRLPRSTVESVVSTLRVVATGEDVESTVPLGSVTVYHTSACCCWLTAFRIWAWTSTVPPGLVKAGLGVTETTCTVRGAGGERPGDRLGDLRGVLGRGRHHEVERGQRGGRGGRERGGQRGDAA